jgi:hypothetical protein
VDELQRVIIGQLQRLDSKLDAVAEVLAAVQSRVEGGAVGLDAHKKECVRRHSTLTKVALGAIGTCIAAAVGAAVKVLA